MKTIKKICDSVDVLCTEHTQHGQKFFLIDGKCVFEKDFLRHPFCRDILVRAWLNYCGVPEKTYFKNTLATLEKELR